MAFCPDPWEPPELPRPTEPPETPDFPWLTPSSSFLGFPIDRDSSKSAWPNFKIIKIIQSDKLCIDKTNFNLLGILAGMPALIGLGIKSICSQFVSLSRTLHLRSPSLYQVLILASGIVISASGMVEILADFLEILSDILINLSYYAAFRSQLDWRLNLYHRDFTRNYLRVKLKYTGNGSWFGVCADFPGKFLARQNLRICSVWIFPLFELSTKSYDLLKLSILAYLQIDALAMFVYYHLAIFGCFE